MMRSILAGAALVILTAGAAAATPAFESYTFQIAVTGSTLCTANGCGADPNFQPYSVDETWSIGPITDSGREVTSGGLFLDDQFGSAGARDGGGVLTPEMMTLSGFATEPSHGYGEFEKFANNFNFVPGAIQELFSLGSNASTDVTDPVSGITTQTFLQIGLSGDNFNYPTTLGPIDHSDLLAMLAYLGPLTFTMEGGNGSTDANGNLLSEDFATYTGTATFLGASVPEPAAWTLMICGFGIAGAALRRRRVLLAA